MPRARSLPAALLCLMLGGCASVSHLLPDLGGQRGEAEKQQAAARLKAVYSLEIDAPSEARALLLQYLDLARFQQIGESEQLSPVELERLVAVAPAQARSLMETLGYFNAEIEVQHLDATPTDAGQRQALRLKVSPGPRTRVEQLDLRFDGGLAPREDMPQDERRIAESLRKELGQLWPLQQGQDFSQARWSEGKGLLLARARSKGYPLAHFADSQADIDAEKNQARLSLVLDSGPLFRLGELQIEGLEFQSADTVSRLAGFKPGEPYVEQTLLDFQERLLSTQLFDGVSVEILPEAGQAEAVPVRVRVKEAARQQATTAIGYSAVTGYYVSAEHQHRLPFELPMRARSLVNLGQNQRKAELELSSHPQPDMQRNLASLQWEQDLAPDLDTRTLNARLGRVREAGHDERLLYLEWLHSYESTEGTNVRSDAVSANVQWTLRRVDSVLLPTTGYTALLSLGAGRADNSVADSGAFARAQLRLGGYRPLGSQWYASARSEFDQIFAGDSVGLPNKLLYQAGGDDSVRGYAPRSLGPLTGIGSAIGGRVMWTGSVELAHPLLERLPMLWGAGFVDAGNAADSWKGLRPVVGVGAGIRLRSPVGSLRLDLARALETGTWRIHFSVGAAL